MNSNELEVLSCIDNKLNLSYYTLLARNSFPDGYIHCFMRTSNLIS